MSKRLVRIASSDILSKLAKSDGVELNAILQNGNTCFGKQVSIDANFLTMLDTRQHTHKLAIADIFEIVYDLKS